MDSGKPLVSIIIIAYDSEKYVLETLESAKEQTYRNIELIISDDYSTDRTVEICYNWIDINKKRFVRTKIITNDINTGIAPNCNRGISAARGEWIKIMAGDDALTKNCIEEYMNYITNNKEQEIEFLHSKAEVYMDDFKGKNKISYLDFSDFKFNNESTSAAEQYQILLRCSPMYTPTVMIKRCIFDRVGLYDERYPLYEDRPMWLKITQGGIKLYYLNKSLVKYRLHNNSVQRKKKDKEFFSEQAIQKNLAYKDLIIENLSMPERILIITKIKIIDLSLKLGFNKFFIISKAIIIALIIPLEYIFLKITTKYR